MLYIRVQRLVRRLAGVSVFGDGVLERARSTYLGLLGGTAAIGLAIVAFVLQLGWPIGADRPLPSAPPKRQAVAAGVAVAAAPSRPAASRRSRGGRPAARRAGRQALEPTGPQPGTGSELVVSQSEPAASRHGHSQGHEEASQGPPAAAPQEPRAPQGGSAASKPPSAPPPHPAPAPEPEPSPEPVAEASAVPGVGNAYGKGNGNGPPAPPPAVGNPHDGVAGSPPGHSGG